MALNWTSRLSLHCLVGVSSFVFRLHQLRLPQPMRRSEMARFKPTAAPHSTRLIRRPIPLSARRQPQSHSQASIRPFPSLSSREPPLQPLLQLALYPLPPPRGPLFPPPTLLSLQQCSRPRSQRAQHLRHQP